MTSPTPCWRPGCSPAPVPAAPGGAIAGRRSRTGRRCIASSSASTSRFDPVGGVHRERARVSLHALLRTLPRLGSPPAGDDAPDRMRPATSCSSTMRATACRWSSTAVPASGAPRISSSRCSAHRASPTRRRPGRRGSPTGSSGHVGLSRHRRRAGAARAGQHQGRGDQGLPLRSADQPQLRRYGGALRYRHSAGEPADGRGTRPRSSRRSLWSSAGCSGGCATAPSTAWPRSTRDRRAADPAQRSDRSALGRTRRQLFEEIDRPALKALAGEPLRVGRVADLPGQHRLSRRGRAGTTTASPIATSAPRSRCAPRSAPSRFSTRASGSPRISA